MRALLAALVLLTAPAVARAQMTCDGANFAFGLNTASAGPTLALPTSAPVGATLVAGILNRTDETTTLTVADGANGAWAVSSPDDFATGTSRAWIAYFLNNGTNAAHTVTFTFSASISSQYVVGWCSEAGGAQTFDSFAAASQHTTATDILSNNVTMDAAGGIVGFYATNNAITCTTDGAGETNIEGGGGGQRITAFFQAVSGAGDEGFDLTCGSATGVFQVGGWLNAGVGATRKRTASPPPPGGDE